MGVVGFGVGFLGFLLHQTIDLIADFKWGRATSIVREEGALVAWCWIFGYSLVMFYSIQKPFYTEITHLSRFPM